MESDWEIFFSSAADSQSDTDWSSSSSFISSGSFTENTVNGGATRRTSSRVQRLKPPPPPRQPRWLSCFLKAPHTDLMKLDYSHLNDVGKGVHTLLQGAIHTGQFRTWDKFNLWLGLGQRVSIAVKAKRADLASEPKPGKGKEIDIHAMTGLTFPKGSWVVRSNEEYDGWNQSHRGVADSTYIGDLYSTATEEATVHFDWTSTAGPDSQVSDQVSMYREYQQDIDRSNEFAQSSGRSRIMDTDPDLPEYQKRQQKMKMDRGMDFAYSSQYNHHAFLWDNKTDGS